MRVVDEHLDVLQDMEFRIVQTDLAVQELSDHDVMRVFEAIKDAYVAEKIGRPPRHISLSETEQLLYENVRSMCEWRLGRGATPDGSPGGQAEAGKQ